MPVTTLTGKNQFQIAQHTSMLKAQFAEEFGDENVVQIDGESASYSDLSGAIFEQGLFASNSFILLRDVAKNKDIQEKLIDMLDKVPDEAELVIADSAIDKRSAFYKALKKTDGFQEFAELDEFALARWATEEMSRMGGELKSAEARLLVERVGPDQWAIKNELDKLLSHEQPITKETIKETVDLSFRDTIFNLLDTAFAKQSEDTLKLYNDMIANKVDPYYILSMIGWQLHAMMLVAHAGGKSDGEIAKEAKISPFVVRKCQNAMRHTTPAKIRDVVGEFVEVDYKSKTSSSVDVEVLAEQLLLKIAS